MSYLDRLNPEQKQAAQHFEGPLLVLAGAGSGKTRVLTTRIAHLIHEYGVAPDSILSLTFTNKAAGEMRERIRLLLDRDPGGMWIGTFHAIGARMLRRDATRLGWSPNFLIYDADDSERVVKRILKDELNLEGLDEQTLADLDRVLAIDTARWQQEVGFRANHLAQFDGLPEEIWAAHRRVGHDLES